MIEYEACILPLSSFPYRLAAPGAFPVSSKIDGTSQTEDSSHLSQTILHFTAFSRGTKPNHTLFEAYQIGRNACALPQQSPTCCSTSRRIEPSMFAARFYELSALTIDRGKYQHVIIPKLPNASGTSELLSCSTYRKSRVISSEKTESARNRVG